MAKRRRYRRQASFTPAIVVLNILIVLVMGLLVYFVYRYITSESETALRTLPPLTVQTEDSESPSENSELTSEETTTVQSLSITKASTTTPQALADGAEQVFSEMGYDESFFANGLFIGDSIMTGFSGFGYLPNEIVFAKIGLNPESVLTDDINGKTAADTAALSLPDRIYIMLGTNGLSFMSGDYMAKQMGILIKELKNSSSRSSVVIMTIPPVTREHERKKPEENIDKINLYNDLLKTLAEENGCYLVDINDLLRDGDGYLKDEFAEEDGLHFLPAAYTTVLSALQTELGLQ